MQKEITSDMCKIELRRAAWRMQNQFRSQQCREIHSEYYLNSRAVYSNLDSDLFVKEMVESLPERGQIIIKRNVLDGVPEVVLARELGICQQGVNRWKKKMLRQLKKNFDLKSS